MMDRIAFMNILAVVGPSPHPGPFPPATRQDMRNEWEAWLWAANDAWKAMYPDHPNKMFPSIDFERWQIEETRKLRWKEMSDEREAHQDE